MMSTARRADVNHIKSRSLIEHFTGWIVVEQLPETHNEVYEPGTPAPLQSPLRRFNGH